jgi:predicted small integral membrane protein
MSATASFLVIQCVVMSGFAMWMTLATFNNLIAFRGGAAGVGMLMSMQPLRQPPAIETPLLERAIERPAWHTATMSFIVLFEILAAACLWYATVMIVGATFGEIDVMRARAVVNLALAVLAALLFFFVLGGTWFAYYIRQEQLQISHFATIGVILVTAILCNLR